MSEALRLATSPGAVIPVDIETTSMLAAELRRLHEANQKLQQQLGEAVWNYGEKVRANQELLEALRLALEALEAHADIGIKADKAMNALREALADSALDRMAENAREFGLDYEPIVEQVEDFVGMGHKAWDMVDPKELAKGFHEALAEPPCKTGSQCTSKCQQCEQPAQQQEPKRWAVFCQGCRKEWSVSYPHPGKSICADCDDKLAKYDASPQPAEQEPVAWYGVNIAGVKYLGWKYEELDDRGFDVFPLYTSPHPSKPLTPREVELLDGMIEVQLDHAKRCDSIANRPMAEKQKAWDMERVELLRKLKAAHDKGDA